ncbi:hypothetical protein FVE85_2749 [Porphyridium purpureum]|uniref:Uncharacterized protein n=1 Tax=Porphyridium purpureum TaxID=35688 RepID=A0A5J4YTL1_PORPP|nr:hypothetical protein FVE85_2749 [Porphyridium purpureum]|eukprot:POR9259..scf227_4
MEQTRKSFRSIMASRAKSSAAAFGETKHAYDDDEHAQPQQPLEHESRVAAAARRSLGNVLATRSMSSVGAFGETKKPPYDEAGNEAASPETEHAQADATPGRQSRTMHLFKPRNFRRAKSSDGQHERTHGLGDQSEPVQNSVDYFSTQWDSEDALPEAKIPRGATAPSKRPKRSMVERNFKSFGSLRGSRSMKQSYSFSYVSPRGNEDSESAARNTPPPDFGDDQLPPSQRVGTKLAEPAVAGKDATFGTLLRKSDIMGGKVPFGVERTQSIRGEASNWDAVPDSYIPLGYDELSEPDSEDSQEDVEERAPEDTMPLCPEKVDSSIGSLCSVEQPEQLFGTSFALVAKPQAGRPEESRSSALDSLFLTATQDLKSLSAHPNHVYDRLLSPQSYTSSSISESSEGSLESAHERWW